ncbi:MAG TPA: APC family permease [Jatrophihabitantaceae bacterium]|jgi:amino acid transporter
MATTSTASRESSELSRSIGFWGLTFVSLGSIIGSGWLLGALNAAVVAGPASLVSWVLSAIILTVLALIHAELGTSYPVAGGTARFPYFAFGALAGFTAGWAAWLQSVAVAPIEVEASLSYLNSIHWVRENLNMLSSNGSLNGLGLAIATVFMLGFTTLNLLGAKLLSESNTLMVLWKAAVPVLAIVVIMSLSFHPSNFTAGGGFAPHGVHGIFAALPLGVVFALQGFEQAVQMAGEAKDPQRHLSRAIMLAMAVGAVLYILLEVCFVGGLEPANLVRGWDSPIGVGDYGPYYTLATTVGAGWLATILIIDAFVSPAGTGMIYVGTSARLSYALGQEEVLPNQLTQVNRRGVPVYSILLAFIVGEIFFLPFPSWSKLVGIITSATAIMYAFAPVSAAALRKRDPDRHRPYKMPWPAVLNPMGFCFANLIIYWSGFDVIWKLLGLIFVGRVLFEVAVRRADANRTDIDWRATSWIWPWLIGMTVISVLGRYGHGHNVLPDWVDLVVVVAFALGVFYYAVDLAMSKEQVQAAIASEDLRLPGEDEVRLTG